MKDVFVLYRVFPDHHDLVAIYQFEYMAKLDKEYMEKNNIGKSYVIYHRRIITENRELFENL